jgi:predicted dehydrogenase
MRKVKWGIIGLGNIAKVFAESFENTSNAELVAISSKDPEKINKFKNRFRIDSKFCYNEYNDLINCKDLDAVYIALPNSLHFHWIKECIKSNKSVLVEKPCVISVQEISKIKDLILKNPVFFCEALHYRYLPQTLKLFELLRENKIGNLISMESYFGHNLLTKKNIFGFTKIKKIKKNNRLFSKQLGGGAILDLGCYPVSLSTFVSSLIPGVNLDAVHLEKKKIDNDKLEVDVDSYAEINFENKFKSLVGVSYKKNLGKITKIIGSNGEINIEDSWHGIRSKISISGAFNEEIEFDICNNVYSYQTESVSSFILQGNKQSIFPGPSIDDSVRNTKIIETWKNIKHG